MAGTVEGKKMHWNLSLDNIDLMGELVESWAS